jgi:predicted O-methyltransferase YrrM
MSIATRLRRTWRTLIGAGTGDPFLDWVPAGHFYSPVPGPDDVARAKHRLDVAGPTLPGIAISPESVVAPFRERAALVRDWDGGAAGGRRYGPNDAFGIGDASMLRATILLARPRRIVEVGSGWSSACTLDTLDDAGLDTTVTFIEPYPELLLERLSEADVQRAEIRAEPLQDVPTEVFSSLVAGDILFIDSSHVFKPGSDVDDYFARILPAVQPGVHVHIHDIFWPFEVPAAWLDEGRSWNEAHALRNFLCDNPAWEITAFNDYMLWFHPDLIDEALPQMMDNAGGSIWLRRRPLS